MKGIDCRPRTGGGGTRKALASYQGTRCQEMQSRGLGYLVSSTTAPLTSWC